MLRCRSSRMILILKMLVVLLCVAGIGMYYRFTVPDQRLCACVKCLSEDKELLLLRMNHSYRPFLTPDFVLSQDAFNWWKRLQNEKRSYETYKIITNNIFKMFPRNPDIIQPKSDRCITCAVVGNSANLRGSHYGPLIDSHEIVIRINRGVTRGFEKDVGNKTTHRVMYPESAMDLDNNTHLVLVPFKMQDIEWLIKAFTTGFTGRSYAPIKSKINAKKNLIMVLNPGFMKYVHEVWLQHNGSYPSTGFMTLILSLHICDEVDVFGYGADSDGNWSHYFEILKDKMLKTEIHPRNYEYAIIQQLAQQQKIQFHTGLMKPKGQNAARWRGG
ncbi:CMP-N-acetylneuraminate-beta-galactosamide-alpha-2,3-sialyltransferase 1-like [Archocentrus centrarchus]|uniref:CMP-N-acetylneuraminate-beta-galactosamide- alpha-2,3-sialyltransferase 1-like n=1 Tax=Archocentrus centrarchus TaxID=63155 RepID=UPI0011E9D9CD|nr:CMP-N-acetylneuraminate-beta-galactosamide-alpha-2,3-sialyltransferase 1-like [Archocentrus centrarchus]